VVTVNQRADDIADSIIIEDCGQSGQFRNLKLYDMTRLAQNKYNKLKYLTYFKSENEYCFLFRVGDSKVPIFIKK